MPLQRYGKHAGTPADCGGRRVHVPSALAPSCAAHTLHAPVQAELQHTPSTQNPLLQSTSAAHFAPAALGEKRSAGTFPKPPVTMTSPFETSVAEWPERENCIDAVSLHASRSVS